MSTITKELAKLFRKITNSEIDAEGNAHVVLSPADSLLINNARIALASLEAEPVAWLLSGGGAKNNVSFDSGNAYADPLREVTPLYTAPPAPVSVPAAMEIDDDFDSAFEHGKAVGWNAYRAAMLQAEPVSNSDELPLDYLQGHKDGLEWAAQLAEANHPEKGDWLYDDPIELAKAIRKGPDMPPAQPVADSEPVIVVGDDGGDALSYRRLIQSFEPGTKLYRHAQPALEREQLAIENFRSAIEGIGHIRRTLEETFGGLHGTHVEPDVLAECKAICDAIYAAYGHEQPAPVVPDAIPVSRDIDAGYLSGWNDCRAAMLNGGKS
ncbi:hypothetical protein [Klebsiella pneumoniae]|uniref:hypothetical protein n=1 Tax=Klebsiella pneumoniae TaxID=573 RepID=UPI003B43C084